MNEAEARVCIKELVAETGGLENAEFPDSTPLWFDESGGGESLNFDSIGLLELSLSLEEAFQLHVDPAEDVNPDDFRTVEAILAYVTARSPLIDPGE
jgi:acyl carrier protein